MNSSPVASGNGQAARAGANCLHVRQLLRERYPAYAAALEDAVQAELNGNAKLAPARSGHP